jgi:hypothetical protein
VLEDFNKKSLNERLNEFTDMLHHASKCAIEMKRCVSHINEWKSVSDEQREEKELCLESLAHQLLIQVSTQNEGAQSYSELLQQFSERVAFVTSAKSTVSRYFCKELEHESRIPETIANVTKLRRMHQLMTKPHIAYTL